jgi:hypothetical protein
MRVEVSNMGYWVKSGVLPVRFDKGVVRCHEKFLHPKVKRGTGLIIIDRDLSSVQPRDLSHILSIELSEKELCRIRTPGNPGLL